MNLLAKWLLWCILLLTFSIRTDAQIISISHPGLKFKEITLGYQYADGAYKIKSTHLNENGFGLFVNTGLKSGIYYIFYNDSILKELLIDNGYEEKIAINYNIEENVNTLTGPAPTIQYNSFLKDLVEQDSKMEGKSLGKTVNDKKKHPAPKLENINSQGYSKQFDSLLQKYISTSTSNFLTAYLLAQTQVEIPEYTPPAETPNPDSTIWAFQLSYYKKHYLDNLDISDKRLIRTPIYTKKLNLFLDQMTSQKPGNLCSAVDYIINKASGDSATQKFVVSYVLNKYEKQKNDPISEYVYLHIIEKHYLQSGYSWITNNDIEVLNKEYNQLKPVSLGQLAPTIVLNDTSGQTININDLKGDFIVLYFMNYECPLCEMITKQVKKTSQKFDYLNFEIVTICLGNDEDDWKSYIKRHGIGNWINLIGEDQMANIALKYNLRYTPTIYLLNSDKVIIDKNMTASQLNRAFLNFALESNR